LKRQLHLCTVFILPHFCPFLGKSACCHLQFSAVTTGFVHVDAQKSYLNLTYALQFSAGVLLSFMLSNPRCVTLCSAVESTLPADPHLFQKV
jgi:hypothetical protein